MVPMLIIEKVVSIAVLLCAIAVGYLTINHGDVPLGMMVLLSQAQSLFGPRGHSTTHDATHVVMHKL